MPRLSFQFFLCFLVVGLLCTSNGRAQSYGLDTLQPIGKFLNGTLPATTPGVGGVSQPPATLSATGVFTNLITLTPRSGLIPYDVNSPLWTDGAAKKRWLAVPNDGVADTAAEKISFSPTSSWSFPKGSVLVKQFDLPVDDTNPTVLKRMETRFLVHGDDGVYYGVTYKWRADGSDADLLLDGENASVTIATSGGGTRLQTWGFPSRTDCKSCHNSNAGHVLGPRTQQLNRDTTYSATGRTDNQLRTLNHLGLFTPALNEAAISGYLKTVAVTDTSASLETRVRSYLDANCSHCHQPGNLATTFDARFTTPLSSQNLIDGSVLYDLGVTDARVIAPQSLARSILHQRISVVGLHQMPPIGRNTVDTAAVAAVTDWIASLPVGGGGTGNRAPVAYDDESSTLAGNAVDVNLTSNDSDADGDVLSVVSAGSATNGAVSLLNSTTARFTPGVGFTGEGTFTYTVQDPLGAVSNAATVRIRVLPAVSASTATFLDVSTRLATPSWTSGVAMGIADMNADGRDDIVHLKNGYELRVEYQPTGTGVFSVLDMGAVSSQRQWSLTLGDADNNGYPDILTGGYYDGLQYFRANGSGTNYTQSILASPTIFAQAMSFADINNDGWLDIFACHDDAESAKFRNTGNGTMVADSTLIDTRTTPVSDNSGNYGIVWTDYDNDGDLDMYLSKCRQGVTSAADPRRINKLMRNNGNGTFTDVAASLGMAFGEQSWAADFADIDNDGDLDCFVGNHQASSYVMRNNGSGAFTNVTAASGVSVTWRVIQNVFRDFNNDGWVDLLLTGEQQQLWLNDRDGTFTLASNPFGTNIMESCAVGDLNKDGFTDVYAGYASLYNTPSTTKPDKLFISSPNGNGFYSLTLRGVTSNRTGSGARIELHGPWGIQVREVRSGESYGITHSFTQIFGMGNVASATKLRVRWPSGTIDEAFNILPNRFATLQEGSTAAPTLANPGPQTNTVGSFGSLSMSGADPTGDTLTFSAVNLPAGMVIAPATGVISGTPATGSEGSYEVTVSISDGWSSTSQTFTWQINPVPVAPTVVLSTSATSVTGPFQVNATFSSNVTGLTLSDFDISNGSVSALAGSGSSWSVTVTPSASGVVQISLPANRVLSGDGLGNVASNQLPVTYTPPDTTPPSVTLSTAASVVTSTTFAVNAQFSETVSGLLSSEFIVTNGTVIGLSGAGSLWVATVQATTVGDVTIRLPAGVAVDGVGLGNTASSTLGVRYDPPAPLVAKVNFQSAGAPRPAGYVEDVGGLFGQRGGLNFGWNISHVGEGRDRGLNSDQRLDTLLRLQSGAVWEMAVPNGQYDVNVSIGDAAASSINTIVVEGVTYFNALRLRATQFRQMSVRVTVSDGRLTLTNGSSGALTTRLNYVDVVAVGASSGGGLTGLTGDYYSGTSFNQLRFTRADPAVDFDWGTATPDARVPADGFSVRWKGAVLPRYTETYSFITTSNDGVRLWINNQLIIDQWTPHATTQHAANISLQAGVLATIKMEYFDNTGDGVARLEWSSNSEARQVIPSSRLRLNENGGSVLAYPATFAAWLSSGRASSGTTLGNADGDYSTDLMEYALGGTAGSGVQAGEGMKLETTGNSAVTVCVVRPSAVSDVVYALEGSTDMVNWSSIAITPSVVTTVDGFSTMRWANVHAASGLSIARGIVRLRVTLSDGSTSLSQPCAWQQVVLALGPQSLGVNTMRAPIFASSVSGVSGATIAFSDAAALGSLVDVDAKYYVEVRNGAYAGHRFDIASVNTGAVTVDLASANNTLAAVPAGLAGALVVIRPHVVLGEIMKKDVFTGTLSPSTADTAMYFSGGAYRNYFFAYGGTSAPAYDYWTSSGDASLTNGDNTLIPPGTGLMMKINGTAKTLLMTGSVRTESFVRKLNTGYNLFASPWPVDASPASSGLTLANGFTGTNSPATADQIQVWGGDTGEGASFKGYFLVNVGTTYRRWSAVADTTLLSVDNLSLLRGGRAVFLKMQASSTINPWRLQAPGSSSGSLAIQ